MEPTTARRPAWDLREARGRVAALRLSRPSDLGLFAAACAAVAATYYLAGRAGLELAYLDGAVTAMWPPAGLGLAALFLFGVRLWPGIVVGDFLLADFSTPAGTILGQVVGNTVAVIAGALLLRRLTEGRAALERVSDVLSFVACAVLTALVSAAFGPLSLVAGDVIEPGQLGEVLRTWTLSDASGALVVAPLLLTWAARGTAGIHRRHAIEGAVVLVVLVLLAELPPQRDVPYVVFPVLLWAALRFGPRGAATAILVVCAITVWNTAQEEGPFVRDSITDSLLATQLFVAISALTSLILAAVTAERAGAARALAAAEAEQRRLAGEQAALRRVATLVAAEAEPRRVFAQVTEEVGRILELPIASVVQYDGGRTATVVGTWAADGRPRFPVGTALDLDGETVVARVLRTGDAQRMEDYGKASGPLGESMRSFGYRSAVAAPVTVGGRLWGALAGATTAQGPLPDGLEQRLCDFAELVAQALANADAYEKLAASRARLVEVGDAERRRLERNLHDGAQQRLVAVALKLNMLAGRIEGAQPAAQELLEAARDDLAQGLDELRELARGIHPVVLTERGLGAALDALVSRTPVDVEIETLPEGRLAPSVEAAAYYIVAEALTNVAKYAQATVATVAIRRDDGTVTVRVADDGVGGADPASGTGLQGLGARVEALNGRLVVDSPRGSGTRIEAEIPLDG